MMVQTEIGLLPEDWEVVQISEVGSNYSYGVGAEAVMYDGKNKYLRITDIDDNSHRYSPAPIVSPSFFSENHILRENEIVVARTGASVGKSYIYDPKDGKLIYAGFLMKFKVADENSKYIFYHLTTKRYNTWVTMNSVRSGQPGLNLVQLKEFQFPLPKDKSEQQNIASALSSIDKLIDDLGRTIQKKQRIREGAMEELLSGKKRLPGFTEEWVKKKIGEVCNTASGGTPSRSNPNYYTGKIKWFTTTELNDGWLLDSIEHISEEAIRNSSAKIFKEGTLLMAMYGATIGKLGILSSEAATNQACCAFESKEMDIIFLFYFLFAKRQQILSLGAGAGQPNISQQIIKNIPINIPPIKEQHAIADILTSMDDEISLLESERAKYEQIRSGMMEELLTGKKRLK